MPRAIKRRGEQPVVAAEGPAGRERAERGWKIWGGNGRDAYGSCFFIPLVPVFNLVVRRGNREFHVHVQTRRRVLSILFLRLGLLSTRRKKNFQPLSLSLSLKRIVPRETENSGTRHYPMTILSVFSIYISVPYFMAGRSFASVSSA